MESAQLHLYFVQQAGKLSLDRTVYRKGQVESNFSPAHESPRSHVNQVALGYVLLTYKIEHGDTASAQKIVCVHADGHPPVDSLAEALEKSVEFLGRIFSKDNDLEGERRRKEIFVSGHNRSGKAHGRPRAIPIAPAALSPAHVYVYHGDGILPLEEPGQLKAFRSELLKEWRNSSIRSQGGKSGPAINRPEPGKSEASGVRSHPPRLGLRDLLPHTGYEFIGREGMLVDLRTKLAKNAQGTAKRSIAWLWGASGVGKSRLASHLAMQMEDEYPGDILLIEFKSHTEGRRAPLVILQDQLWRLTGKTPPSDLFQARKAYLELLQQGRGTVILDDVMMPSADAVTAESADLGTWKDLLPPPHWLTLVTSRHRLEEANGYIRLKVGGLTDEEMRKLALAMVGDGENDVSPEEWVSFVVLCKGNPKVLELAIPIFRDDPEGKAGRQRFLRTFQMQLSLFAEKVMAAGYAQLTENERRALRALAVVSGDLDFRAMLAVAGCEKATLVTLLGRSWVDGFGKDEDARFYCHDLVLAYLTGKLSQEDRAEAMARFAGHMIEMIAEWEEAYLGDEASIGGLVPYGREIGHIGNILDWLMATCSAQTLPLRGRLAAVGRYLLPLRFAPKLQIQLLEAATVAAEKLGHTFSLGLGLCALGWAYLGAGNLDDAIETYRQALNVTERLKKGKEWAKDERVLAFSSLAELKGEAYGGVAHALYSRGDAKAAIENGRRALVSARNVPNARRRDRLMRNVYRVLGHACLDLGQFAEAAKAHQAGLQRCVPYENDPIGVGLHQSGLAAVALARGRWKEATEGFEEACRVVRPVGDRWADEEHLGNLGESFHLRGLHDQAMEAAQKALEIAESIGERRGIVAHRMLLGRIYREQGDFVRARENFVEARDISRAIGDRRREARAMDLLAEEYMRNNERSAARRERSAASLIWNEIGGR